MLTVNQVKKYANMNPNDTQRKYLNSLIDKLMEYEKITKELTELFSDGLYGNNSDGIDLNDYISPKFPFKQSFDEIAISVKTWQETACERLALATYQPETDPINKQK